MVLASLLILTLAGSAGPADRVAHAAPAAPAARWPVAGAPRVSNLFHAPLRLEAARGYLHGGIDIRAPAGTPVVALARGTVWVYREGPFDNIELTEADGSSWEIRHLAADRVPEAVLRAMEEGTAVEAGAALGEVGPWGLDYSHIHLNRRRADGTIADPLAELPALADGTAPLVRGIHLAPAGASRGSVRPEVGATVVAGAVDIIADIADALDGEPEFLHPPRLAVLTLVAPDGTATEIARWDPFLESLPERTPPTPRFPRTGLAAYERSGPLATANPIPARGEQRFSLVLTNVIAGAVDAAGAWDTARAADGPATLRVEAWDRAGNAGSAELAIEIRNGSETPVAPDGASADAPVESLVERELAHHAHATGFRGDVFERTFALPAAWGSLRPRAPEGAEVLAPDPADPRAVTVRIDTTRQPERIHTWLFPVYAVGVRIGALAVTVEAAPLVEIAPSARRIRRESGAPAVHLRLRTPGAVALGEARWRSGERSGVAQPLHDETVDPHCRLLAFAVPEEALGGTLFLEVRAHGRSTVVEIALEERGEAPRER